MKTKETSQEMVVALVKKWGWTGGIVVLLLLLAWQGLTLYRSMQSWTATENKVRVALSGDSLRTKKGEDKGVPEAGRQVGETFFFRPKPEYKISAILDGKAVINGKEVRQGDRVDKAVVETIGVGTVTIREDGSDSPRELAIHRGL